MADDGDEVAARRSYSRAASQSGSLGVSDLKQRMVKLDGEFKGLRAQVTQIWKLLDAKGVAPKDDAGLRDALQEERRLRSQETKGLREELQRQKQEMRKQQQEIQQFAKELQRHAKELHLQSKLGLDHNRHATTVQAVSDDLFRFKRQIYDSGVLVPKLPVVEEAPEPPVGALELGEDVYSARLLIRLGFMKANKDARKLLLSGEAGPTTALEVSSDEEQDLSFYEEEDLVLGLQPIEIRKGDPGYWQITTGWLLVVFFTQFLQFVALCNLLGYGISKGNSCLKEELSGGTWWMLHLSKAAGMLAVGALMAGRIMDTVNFLMVEVLIEKGTNFETIFFAIFRLVEIVLIIFCNLAIFITAMTPDGVWLSITAITFVADLPESVTAMGKSGVLGHHICKQITEMQFQVCLGAEYPWWFKPVRYVTHVIMFGTIGAGACYAFVVPMQLCPDDFSPPENIFLKWFQ